VLVLYCLVEGYTTAGGNRKESREEIRIQIGFPRPTIPNFIGLETKNPSRRVPNVFSDPLG